MSDELELDQILKNARPGQREAFSILDERFLQGERHSTVVLPTRYGKSDLIRLLAWYLQKQGRIHTTLVLNPNITLRHQTTKKTKTDEFLKRFSVTGWNGALEVEGRLWNPGSNGETLLSATIQTVSSHIDDWELWTDSCINQKKKPPLIVVDESHSATQMDDLEAESKKWGIIERLSRRGALAMFLTATPERADGEIPVGFRYETVTGEDVKRCKTKIDKDDPNWIEVTKYWASQSKIRLIPDYEMTFADAWAETPSPLCKISRLPFDVELWKMEGENYSEGEMLSSLSPSQCLRNGLLSKIGKEQIVIERAVKQGVVSLATYKVVASDCGAIVFCGNDTDPENKINEHAKKIERAFKIRDSSLKVVIATSASAGKDLIDRFQDGDGDVLIVKQMGSLGIDIPRLKVAVDLSPVRTYAANVQRLTRVCTPHGLLNHAVLITPNDFLGRANFERLIGDVGDGWGDWTTRLQEIIESYRVPRRENEEPLFGVMGTSTADFEDTNNTRAEAQMFSTVEKFFCLFPEFISTISYSEVAHRLKEGGVMIAKNDDYHEEARDINKEIELRVTKIHSLTKDMVNHRLNGNYSSTAFGEEQLKIWTTWIYPLIPKGVKFEQIRDLALLEKLVQSLQRAWANKK